MLYFIIKQNTVYLFFTKFAYKKIFFIVFVLLALAGQTICQTTITSDPYFCGFENPQDASEIWTFDFGNNKSIWEIGSALSSEGQNSLYISSDGGITAGFTSSPAGYVAVYKDFILNTGRKYEISFDWMNPSSGKLYVCWINPNSPSNPSQWSGNSVFTLPAYVKNNNKPWSTTFAPGTNLIISADTLMQNSHRWQKGTFTVDGTGTTMRLLFFWMNDIGASGTGAAIDNVQIGRTASCGTISEIKYEIKGDGTGEFTWEGGSYGPTYDFMYKDTSNVWITYDSLTTPSVTVPELPVGVYTIWVRMHCNGYTTIWYMLKDFYIHETIESCLDYLDITSNNVVATYGVFGDPLLHKGVINEGPDSRKSRLTIHSNVDEYDERTGFKLKTVPPGNIASVRLGNWNTGAEAESVTYDYTVDSLSVLMLLKYAVVMEDPSHDHAEQPKFMLEVFDSNDNPIQGTCGYENFVSGDVNTVGWTRYGSTLWKDWSGFGLNLEQHIGKRIKIRLTTYDCKLSGHYGYAYFTLDCARAEITGVTCGENEVETLSAPEGYSYKWYPKSKQDSIVSTERTFQPLPTDTGTFVCEMSYKAGECSFKLEASLKPRSIVAEFKPIITYKNCSAEVELRNTSHTTTTDGEIGECERFLWEWNDGYTSTDKDHKRTFNKGGKYTVNLTTSIAKGKCFEVISDSIFIPELTAKYDTIKTNICEGEPPFEYNGIYYSKTGLYTAVKTKSFCDCDSTVFVDLKVNNKYRISSSDELLLYKDSYYDFNETKLKETGIYIDTLTSISGCDSIVTLNLSVYPKLAVELLNDSILLCGTDEDSFVIDYRIREGRFSTYSLFFDNEALKAGFENKTDIVPLLQDKIEISVPEKIRPNKYVVDIIFQDYYSGNDTLRALIEVNYPRTILAQKWNDVIAILNAEYNGGGYTFSDYQWYKNGEPLLGETKSYLYVPEKLDLNAEYTVRLTRSDDGITAFSCPIILEKRTELSVYPTLVKAGEKITIECADDSHIEIWDVMGLKITEQALHAPINNIAAPNRRGAYLVLIKNNMGRNENFTIIVQ